MSNGFQTFPVKPPDGPPAEPGTICPPYPDVVVLETLKWMGWTAHGCECCDVRHTVDPVILRGHIERYIKHVQDVAIVQPPAAE